MRISDWSSDVCSSDLPVDAGQPFLPDLRAQPLFDRIVTARPEIEIDQFAGTLAQTMADIVAVDDEIGALLVTAAQNDVGAGMDGVDVVVRPPVELLSAILLYPRHHSPAECFHILLFRSFSI